MAADNKSNQQQILQGAFDTASQSLKVKLNEPVDVEFSGGTQEVEIDAQDGDNIAIADAVTGNKATVSGGRLAVDISGSSTVTGTVSIPPSTDFSPKTVTITNVEQQLTFPLLAQVTSIAIRALGLNTEDIKIKRSSGAADFYLLAPGEAVNLPVSGGATVFLIRDSAGGTCQVTAIAVN